MTEAFDLKASLATLARYRADRRRGGRKAGGMAKAKADHWRQPAEAFARRTRQARPSISTGRLAALIMDLPGAPQYDAVTAFIRVLERLADNPLPRSTKHPLERKVFGSSISLFS